MGFLIVTLSEKILFVGGIGSNDDKLPTETLSNGNSKTFSKADKQFDLDVAFTSKVIKVPRDILFQRYVESNSGTTQTKPLVNKSETLVIAKTTRGRHEFVGGYTVSQTAIQPYNPAPQKQPGKCSTYSS